MLIYKRNLACFAIVSKCHTAVVSHTAASGAVGCAHAVFVVAVVYLDVYAVTAVDLAVAYTT